jgi:hypothetical protein
MPATGNFVLDKGFDAAAAITKFRAVKMSADETVTPVTAVGDTVVGVEQFGVAAGEITKGKGASVRMQGITEMDFAGACAAGVIVGINASGQAVDGAAAAAGTRIIGVCIKSASGASTRGSVELDLPGYVK